MVSYPWKVIHKQLTNTLAGPVPTRGSVPGP
jgi:hypothetical protein